MEPACCRISREGFAAEEEGGVADVHIRDVRDIDHDLIHADAAGNRGFLSVEDDVAFGAVGADVTVGVADGERGDDAFALGDELAAIADGFAGMEMFEEDDFRIELHRLFERDGMRDLVRRPEAVLDDADAHHVVMSLGDFEDGRAFGDMADGDVNAACFDGVERLLESGELLLRVRLVFAVGGGEMGECALELEARQSFDIGSEVSGFFGTDADAAHARLNLEMDFRRLAEAHGGIRKRLRELLRADGLRDAEIDDGLRFLGENHAEEQDGLRETGLPELDALADGCNGEIVRAMLDGDARARNRAVAIGVGFDDDAEFRAWADAGLDVFEVFGISGEVDFGPGGAGWHDLFPLSDL